MKCGGTGNPAETEVLRTTKPPSEYLAFFFFGFFSEYRKFFLLSTERGRNDIACSNAALKEELTWFNLV